MNITPSKDICAFGKGFSSDCIELDRVYCSVKGLVYLTFVCLCSSVDHYYSLFWKVSSIESHKWTWIETRHLIGNLVQRTYLAASFFSSLKKEHRNCHFPGNVQKSRMIYDHRVCDIFLCLIIWIKRCQAPISEVTLCLYIIHTSIEKGHNLQKPSLNELSDLILLVRCNLLWYLNLSNKYLLF